MPSSTEKRWTLEGKTVGPPGPMEANAVYVVAGPAIPHCTEVEVIPADSPNVLSVEEAKLIVACYFNEDTPADPEPVFTRLGEWADEQEGDPHAS